MGVLITLVGPRGGLVDITPGWRSKMYGLLSGEFGNSGDFLFHTRDVPQLQHLADNQCKGESEPPFDWVQDIHDSFMKIITQIEKHDRAVVECVW